MPMTDPPCDWMKLSESAAKIWCSNKPEVRKLQLQFLFQLLREIRKHVDMEKMDAKAKEFFKKLKESFDAHQSNHPEFWEILDKLLQLIPVIGYLSAANHWWCGRTEKAKRAFLKTTGTTLAFAVICFLPSVLPGSMSVGTVNIARNAAGYFAGTAVEKMGAKFWMKDNHVNSDEDILVNTMIGALVGMVPASSFVYGLVMMAVFGKDLLLGSIRAQKEKYEKAVEKVKTVRIRRERLLQETTVKTEFLRKKKERGDKMTVAVIVRRRHELEEIKKEVRKLGAESEAANIAENDAKKKLDELLEEYELYLEYNMDDEPER